MPVANMITSEEFRQMSREQQIEYMRNFRACGECYACCVHLGIEELKKWPGQACKHLDGAHGPEHRCSIYEKRPGACSGYYCAWLVGFGAEGDRPDKSGVLCTLYPPTESGGPFNATLHVFDATKSGAATDPDSPLARLIHHLIEEGCNEIRVCLSPAKPGSKLLHFRDGMVRQGKILPAGKDGFENLSFMVQNKPVGSYYVAERPKK